MTDAIPSPPLGPRDTKVLVETSITGMISMLTARAFTILGIPLLVWFTDLTYDVVHDTQTAVEELKTKVARLGETSVSNVNRLCNLEVTIYGASPTCNNNSIPLKERADGQSNGR